MSWTVKVLRPRVVISGVAATPDQQAARHTHTHTQREETRQRGVMCWDDVVGYNKCDVYFSITAYSYKHTTVNMNHYVKTRNLYVWISRSVSRVFNLISTCQLFHTADQCIWSDLALIMIWFSSHYGLFCTVALDCSSASRLSDSSLGKRFENRFRCA